MRQILKFQKKERNIICMEIMGKRISIMNTSKFLLNLGLFVLLLLLTMLLVNIKKAIKTKDFVLISFEVLMISLFLTKSFLSGQRGIVFFTALYCLFNSEWKTIKKLNN